MPLFFCWCCRAVPLCGEVMAPSRPCSGGELSANGGLSRMDLVCQQVHFEKRHDAVRGVLGTLPSLAVQASGCSLAEATDIPQLE